MDDSRIVLYLDDFELNCDERPEVPTIKKTKKLNYDKTK